MTLTRSGKLMRMRRNDVDNHAHHKNGDYDGGDVMMTMLMMMMMCLMLMLMLVLVVVVRMMAVVVVMPPPLPEATSTFRRQHHRACYTTFSATQTPESFTKVRIPMFRDNIRECCRFETVPVP